MTFLSIVKSWAEVPEKPQPRSPIAPARPPGPPTMPPSSQETPRFASRQHCTEWLSCGSAWLPTQRWRRGQAEREEMAFLLSFLPTSLEKNLSFLLPP